MTASRKLMAILAHPDDESLGTGSTLARYAAEGVKTYLVCATRGERGWSGKENDFPGLAQFGKMREAELRCAAAVLGLHEVNILDYIDGDLDDAEGTEVIAKLVQHIRRVRPQVVITFGIEGVYGHPDHIAICQHTNAALVCAADPTYPDPAEQPTHRVSKLYYMLDSQELVDMFEGLYGKLSMEIDGEVREHIGWPKWALSARLDNRAFTDQTIRAIQCHRSQIDFLGDLDALPQSTRDLFAGINNFFRAYSLVNSGRRTEDDLFDGIPA